MNFPVFLTREFPIMIMFLTREFPIMIMFLTREFPIMIMFLTHNFICIYHIYIFSELQMTQNYLFA